MGGADTDSIAAGGNETSDVFTLDATCIAAQIQLKADNSTTPASDDQIDFYLLQTSGDPDVDPDSADEYDTTAHARFLARLDTNEEDPAIITVPIPVPQAHCKIYATGADSGTTNAITVSAQLVEQRSG